MKQTLIIAALTSVFAINVNASEQDDGFWFPNENLSELTNEVMPVAHIALNDEVNATFNHEASMNMAENKVNNAQKLKFVSRRAAQNPAVKNKQVNNNDDAWIGASYEDEKASKASKRLNRQFRSKRPHIDYQFD